jgi:hypothetical protein
MSITIPVKRKATETDILTIPSYAILFMENRTQDGSRIRSRAAPYLVAISALFPPARKAAIQEEAQWT